MISIVIPAYNVESTIGACLDALIAQATPDTEIIVVDDGSTDTTRAVAEAKGVRVITQSNRGAAAARNTGVQHARGDLVLFLDADSVPDAHWLAKLSAPFADANVVGASGQKKTRQKNLWARYIQAEYDYRYDRLAAHRTIDFIDSSTAAYRRDIFLANGGFDPTLLDAEDVEFSFRLAERGYAMILVRDAIVWHTHPASLSEFLRRKYRYALWRARVYARFPHKVVADTRTPPSQKFQIALAFLLIPFTLASVVWNSFWFVLFGMLVLFGVTTLSFVAYCWRISKALALVVPLILFLAAYAGSAGILVGTLQARMR
jgi:cellulose synthase/poly-beta-1,6-N-acetylglucosamine synthase-like glycosyltransferase